LLIHIGSVTLPLGLAGGRRLAARLNPELTAAGRAAVAGASAAVTMTWAIG
jgi:hypothetical protein